MGIYAIMLPSSGFSLAHYANCALAACPLSVRRGPNLLHLFLFSVWSRTPRWGFNSTSPCYSRQAREGHSSTRNKVSHVSLCTVNKCKGSSFSFYFSSFPTFRWIVLFCFSLDAPGYIVVFYIKFLIISLSNMKKSNILSSFDYEILNKNCVKLSCFYTKCPH